MTVTLRILDSVVRLSYFVICNVLHTWTIQAIDSKVHNALGLLQMFKLFAPKILIFARRTTALLHCNSKAVYCTVTNIRYRSDKGYNFFVYIILRVGY